MSIILLIIIVLAVPFVIFYISKMSKKGEAERKKQEEIRHAESEKVMRPQRKLHEEEKTNSAGKTDTINRSKEEKGKPDLL
jgi:predicted Holliday junction resolvase-like endonuclease